MLKQPRSRSNEDPFFFLTTTHILFLAKRRIIHFQVPKSFLCVSCSSKVFFFFAPNVSPFLPFLSFYLCAIAVNVCLCALPRRIFSHCLLHHIASLPLAVLQPRRRSRSDVVTMALQMSPVDAHTENYTTCYNQPAVLLPEAAAGTSSHQVEPFQCQLLECFSAEQVPHRTEQKPVPPSLRKFEQRVTAVRKEGAVEVMDAPLLAESAEVRCGPEVEDLRGGAASEILTLLEVSQSSVIDSSKVGSSSEESTHPGTHESPSNPPSPCLVDNAEIGSASAISSSSNILNDAQKDSSDAMRQSGLAWRPQSSNQLSMTFSGETNPPSATYADLCPLSTSAHSTLGASASAVSDEDYCDSKEPLIIKGSSSSRSTSAFLQYPPIGPASNRHWGIPQGAGLRGGAGETSLNNGGGSWGHPPASGGWGGGGTNNAANQVQGQWGAASSAANQRSSAASQGPSGAPPPGSSGPQGSNQQLPTGAQQQQQPQGAWDTSKNVVSGNVVQPSGSSPSQGVWAAQAAKNVPNQPTNTNPNQDIMATNPLNLAQGGNGGGGAVGGSGPATPSSGKPDPLANYRDVIYAQDGWGGNQVNQDSQWDVPTSPEPKEIPLWKQTASNGTEVWEVNLRNGGQAPPPITQTKTPWGSHTPATNLGGTWGEDDESSEPSSMWTGVPANNGPTNWGANPMGAALTAGPMGPASVPTGAATMGTTGITSGNGMWGGQQQQQQQPKKEPEWAGPSSMQTGPGGWGEVRPPQRMAMSGIGPSVPENMGMAPTAPSHWPGPQNKPAPQWGGNVPSKEMKPSGWDEHSPPAQKRQVPQYDDGTAVWGNPSQIQQPGGNVVCRWKDMPNPNVAGGRGMQQSGPPPNRMPPGPGMKADMSWGQTRNGSWGDGVGDSNQMNNMWMDDKPVGSGGGGGSWNEPPQTPTPWASGPKPKTPTTPSWGETEDNLSWGQPHKQVPKPLAKEMIWNSKQFRILSEMGFKKDDVENVLRNCNMVMEDALETLRSGRGMFGDDHGSGGYDPMGPHGGAPYPPSARFNPGQQMPFVHPGSSGAPHHLLSNPAPSMGMNPNPAYKILQPQQPPPMPPQVNQSQMVRNMSRVDTGVSSGAGAGSQPSPTQLRILVQQIQMAVQAGHLNPQILNQPLAPQTLVLLNQLLQQIKVLQQLGQQHNMALSRPGQGPMGGPMLQLVPQMNKTKQQIASLQQQIAAQQALYVKQQGQMMNQQPPGVPPSQPSDLFKVDSVHGIQSNLDRMSLQDSGQSRLSQWKYPPLDKDLSDLGMSEFSRAPGSSGGAPGSIPSNAKPPLGSSLSSPNMNPVLGQDGGAWSSLSRSQSETGWPDTNQDLSTAGSVGGNDGKDSWSNATGSSSYSGSISDLVPEFEPGKPWKGPQIKTADDDPTLTPGTFAMSGLNEADVYSNNASKGGQSSTKASPPPVGTGGSSGSGESGFPTLGLSNSTWSFNPSSASSSSVPSSSTPYSSAKIAPKSSWSDAPPPAADPWSAPNKPRGPPPGISASAGVGPKTAGRDWSAAGSRSPWPGTNASVAGGTWAGSLNGASSWLVLRNLTPQIDGSTLKTLCVQHGPLHNFHLYLNHGVALIRYSTGEEAAKAQSALNNCVLGNTTIYADLANESDVQGWLQQLGMPAQQQQQQQQQNQQQQQQVAASSGWGIRGSTPGSGSNSGSGNGGGVGSNASKGSANSGDNWGTGGGGPSSSPWSTGSNSVWSTPALDRDLRTTPSSLNASLNSFLPGDLLGNESM